MAIVPMTDAVSGGTASSAEYNKLIDNIQDLDARLGAVVSTNTAHARLNTLESRTTDASTGNTALGTRVSTLESGHFARYTNAAAQTIPDGVDTKVIFGTAVATTPDITANAAFDTFTVNRAGIYSIDVSVRGGGVTYSGTPTKERLVAITNGGTASTDRLAGKNEYRESGQLCLFGTFTTKRFNVGDLISVTYKHFSGASGAVEQSGEQTSISICWIRSA